MHTVKETFAKRVLHVPISSWNSQEHWRKLPLVLPMPTWGAILSCSYSTAFWYMLPDYEGFCKSLYLGFFHRKNACSVLCKLSLNIYVIKAIIKAIHFLTTKDLQTFQKALLTYLFGWSETKDWLVSGLSTDHTLQLKHEEINFSRRTLQCCCSVLK